MAVRYGLIVALALGVLLAHWVGISRLRLGINTQVTQRLLPARIYTRVLLPTAPAHAVVTRPQPVAVVHQHVVPVRTKAETPTPDSMEALIVEKEVIEDQDGSPPAQGGTPTDQTAFSNSLSTGEVPSSEPAAPPQSSPQPPVSVHPPVDHWPPGTRLNYRLSGYYRGELYGRARVQWQRIDAVYETHIAIGIGIFASMTLTSQGKVTANGLVPDSYEEVRNGTARSVRLNTSSIALGDGRLVPRPDAVQDTASQFVELSHRFASGATPLQLGQSVALWLARPGGVDLWTYDIVEREVLETPRMGSLEAFRLKPRPIANPRGNISAEIWFAPSLAFLPVRIRINLGDSAFVDLLVDSIEQQ